MKSDNTFFERKWQYAGFKRSPFYNLYSKQGRYFCKSEVGEFLCRENYLK